MSRSQPSDEQAWLPFDEFLASGAKPPAEARSAARGASNVRSASLRLPTSETPALELTSPAGAAVATPTTAQPLLQARIVTVTDLTRLVRSTLTNAPGLRDVWVEGEVGQVTISSAGHCYFTLKDQRSSLSCMVFRDDRMAIPFEPRTGLRLVAHGRLDVFEAKGTYQLYVDSLQPSGFGDLAIRFEELKAKLSAEGLFDPSRRRPLPPQPEIIGIATSLSGAVLHDIRKVLARRWPLARVVVAACQVQGEGAPQSIVSALRRLARWTDSKTGRGTDVVILARGGGSMEDLWAFNEEAVVRAVAAHPCPIVVGVGHETDVTLAEFAADVRAATPSVAAELVVPARTDRASQLRALRVTLDGRMAADLGQARRTLDAERRALDAFRPASYLAGERERIGLLLDRATRAVQARIETDNGRLTRMGDRMPLLLQGRLARARTDLGRATSTLDALSPFATLERGYAIVRSADGSIVRAAADTAPGQTLDVRLNEGSLDVRVERVRDSAA
jgi:exodeoxyribonuclease VII large subunit